MQESLWIDNPSVLFNSENWMKFVPQAYMNVPTALNALVRFVTYTCVILALAKDSTYILGIPLVLVFTVIAAKLFPDTRTLEAFTEPVMKQVRKYTMPSAKNPFMNPLLTEIQDNPNRPDAAPITSHEVKKQVEHAFQQTSDLHMDSSDRFDLSQAMRTFHTLQASTIPSNQDGFLKFLAKGLDEPDYSSAFPSRNAKEKSEGYVEALGSMKSLPNSTAKPTGLAPASASGVGSKKNTLS
jgi:hypothetical protein